MSTQPLRIWYIELQDTMNSIESIVVVHDDHRYSIPLRGKLRFREDFDQPLTVQGETISILVARRRKWHIGPKKAPEVLEINVHDVPSELPMQEFRTVCNKLVITLGLSPNSVPATTGSGRNANALRPTTEEMLHKYSRFRILVIGKSGVGKSTLINKAFGIEEASAADFQPGKGEIEKELVSPRKDQFVLRDSNGFEPAEDDKYKELRSFIEDRKQQKYLKDQLHAVWLCFQIPILEYGERLLEEGVATFLEDTSALRGIPIIVVFTKYDCLLAHMAVQAAGDPDQEAKKYLQVHCVDPIAKFSRGTDLSYVAVSSRSGYEQRYDQLIELTYAKVNKAIGSRLPSLGLATTLTTGSTLSYLKIEASIAVGEQRYWRMLASNPDFEGYTIQECLQVIHTDIVSVWNFRDPSDYLISKEFQGLMINMAGTIDKSTPESTRLVLPFATGLPSVQWVCETYVRPNNAYRKLMAYIVDLIHVLGILFTLTANYSQNITKVPETGYYLI